MLKLRTANGDEALVGQSRGYWLQSEDFVTSEDGEVNALELGELGFPRDWPAAYSKSAALKALIGKRGRIPAKRVAVAGLPAPEDLKRLAGLVPQALQSFANAERAAAQHAGVSVVQGWAVFERLDRPVGAVFVAERYWWNALPDGQWVDLTPRPEAWSSLLLAEAAQGAPKSQQVLAQADAHLAACLLRQRFPGQAAPSSTPAPESQPSQKAPEQRKGVCAPPPPRKIEPASAVRPPQPAAARPAAAAAQPAQASPTRISERDVKAAAKPAKKNIDYSKFDNIEDSDEEAERASRGKSNGNANRPTLRIISAPTEAVSLEDYKGAFMALLDKADPPTVVPDIESMYKAFKVCPDTTDRALLDQACHVVEGVPFEAMRHGYQGWKSGTAQMTQAMLTRQRYDEARMWCVVRSLRMPDDIEPLHIHAWCLEEQWTHVLHSGEAKVRKPTWQGSQLVDAKEYAECLQAALRAHLERSIELSKDGKPTASFAGLSASLERTGDVQRARKVGRDGVKRGIWKDEWQRPAHYVKSLVPCQAWHEPATIEMCAALEQAMPNIKEEFDRYMAEGGALKEVGIRSGEAMLVETGSWREIPLFNAGRMDHEICSKFPETVRILTERCSDATGLAFCGGGEVAFRILGAGTQLKPHCGPTNARLTCQLGISVPLGAEPGVTIAGGEPRPWVDGKCIVFDDSFEHSEALDEMAEGDCVVFTVHFWHPCFQHKNDPDWKSKGTQEESQDTAGPAAGGLFTPMGNNIAGGAPSSAGEADLPPID